MNWLKDYRDIILTESPVLLRAGLSYLGEDDNAMKFMDRHVLITFSVERYAESLSVLVKFLSDAHPDDQLYALHIIMSVFHRRDLSSLLEIKAPEDRVRVVKGYMRFVAEHKQDLFGEVFPLADAYRDYLADAGRRIEAMFLQSAREAKSP